MTQHQHIGIVDICVMTGLSRRSIYYKEKLDIEFPKRVEIVPGRKLPIYLKSEVEQWNSKYSKRLKTGRPKNSDNQNIKIINNLLSDSIMVF